MSVSEIQIILYEGFWNGIRVLTYLSFFGLVNILIEFTKWMNFMDYCDLILTLINWRKFQEDDCYYVFLITKGKGYMCICEHQLLVTLVNRISKEIYIQYNVSAYVYMEDVDVFHLGLWRSRLKWEEQKYTSYYLWWYRRCHQPFTVVCKTSSIIICKE